MTSEESSGKERTPRVIGVIVVVALVVIVGLVGYFSTRLGGTSPEATTTPPPLTLELPMTAGDYSRDPNVESSPEPGGENDLEVRSATYVRNGADSLLVLAGRPVKTPEEMLALLPARGVQKMGTDGACGRSPEDYDVCVVLREDVGILAVALEDQTPEEIIAEARLIAKELPRSQGE